MRLPFAIAAVTATVGLTGLIVAGVSRGQGTAGDDAGRSAAAPVVTEPDRLIDGTRLARGLAAMSKAAAPSRDPFEFAVARRADREVRRTQPPDSAEEPWAEVSRPAPPVLALLGIAEDIGEDGQPVRTAIVGGMNQVFLVKTGDQIAFRFLVREVSRDGVDIEDLTDDAVLRLPLR